MLNKYLIKTAQRFCSFTPEPTIQYYKTIRRQQLEKYSAQPMQTLSGQYSMDGANKFSQKNPQVLMKTWVSNQKMKNSNIGVGTYKGSLDQSDDILQFNALIDSVLLGTNVIDTCRNFRGGRSETVIGKALRFLIQQKKYERKQFLLSSKAGYVRQKLNNQLASQVINEHCVHPKFLAKSLHQSLQALRIKTLDVFYLNNFAESQLQQLGKQKFQQKLEKAFQFCERAITEKKIQFYGMASWQSFRLPSNHSLHLNLSSIVKVAQKVGGKNHGFRFLQVPINIMMPEAFAQKNQQNSSLVESAQNLKVNLVSCSPLLNGTLIHISLPADKLICRSNGGKHLQIIRSIPSQALTCTLIGQKTNRHTKKNLQVLKSPLLNEQEWFSLFVPQEQPTAPQQSQSRG